MARQHGAARPVRPLSGRCPLELCLVGRALLADLERRAREAGCKALDLDSGVQRYDAHRFYLREQMSILSHHFAKLLD